MKLPGEFQKKKLRYKRNQIIYNACKKATLGINDVWITVQTYELQLVRCKLRPVNPKEVMPEDYACSYGVGAIIMIHGKPTYVDLSGKDGRVYLPTNNMTDTMFRRQALAFVEEVYSLNNIPK